MAAVVDENVSGGGVTHRPVGVGEANQSFRCCRWRLAIAQAYVGVSPQVMQYAFSRFHKWLGRTAHRTA
eukprot:3804524-Pleurochrysis_carterae.AAC.1